MLRQAPRRPPGPRSLTSDESIFAALAAAARETPPETRPRNGNGEPLPPDWDGPTRLTGTPPLPGPRLPPPFAFASRSGSAPGGSWGSPRLCPFPRLSAPRSPPAPTARWNPLPQRPPR